MKQFEGKVIPQGDKNLNTATVLVERFWQHPIYKKRVKRDKKYLCENEIKAKAGDKVLIQECRPLSKRKRFKIIKVINK